jgi:cyclohexanecarboxyl-CoA dehydrogenase
VSATRSSAPEGAAGASVTGPFAFTDEHELFRDTIRAFARDKFASGYHARAQRKEFPASEYQLMVDQGLLGLTLPEGLGGEGGDPMAYAIAMEELSWADVNLADLILLPTIAVLLLADTGVALAERIAAGVAGGTRRIGLGLTEPGAGSDAGNLRTRAVPERGGWRLHGEKTSVTSAPHLDCAVVFATTPAGGSTAFLVELDDTVSRQRFNDPGLHPVARGSLTFDGTFVPAANRLSEEGRGFQKIMHVFDLSRSIVALMACGAAQRAIDMTVDYVKERHAFGRSISNYQGVSFTLAESDTHLELTRTLAYRAIGLRMAGRPHTREAAMVKWFGPERAVQAIHDCVILHGHYGWSEELPLQQLMRDVSSMEIADGTPQIQKLVIARRLLGRAAVQ